MHPLQGFSAARAVTIARLQEEEHRRVLLAASAQVQVLEVSMGAAGAGWEQGEGVLQ